MTHQLCIVLRSGALLLVLIASPAWSAELSVGSGAGCDLSDLDDAIAAASSGDTLRLQAEVFTDLITIDRSLALIGGHLSCTDSSPTLGETSTIENPLLGSSSIVSIAGLSTDASLSQITIEGANNSGGDGGGIYVGPFNNLELTQVVIRNNEAANGGGIYVDSNASLATSASSLTLSVTDNAASGVGGGIYAGSSASLTLSGAVVDISGNVADNAGGGIYASGNADLSLSNADISNNTSTTSGGGGLYSSTGTSDRAIDISNSTFSGNLADLSGGGLFVFGNSGAVKELNVANTTIDTNIAGSNGAGLGFAGALQSNLTDTTITGNTAGGDGGGISSGSGGTISASGVVITNNTATDFGGGIRSSGDLITFNGATGTDALIDGNSADRGGGIWVGNQGTVRTNLSLDSGLRVQVSNNQATAGGGAYVTGGSELVLFQQNEFSGNLADDDGAAFSINGTNSALRANAYGSGGQRRLLITDNIAQGNGGAIAVDAGSLELSGVRFGALGLGTGNAASNGGAVFADNGADISIVNSLFESNSATFNGGALFLGPGTETFVRARTPNDPEPADVNACDPGALPADQYCSSLSSNVAGQAGGAVYVTFNATTNIYKTLFAANGAGSGAALAMAEGANLLANNILVTDHQQAIDVAANASLLLQHATVSANTESAIRVANTATSELTLFNSIVWGNNTGVDFGASSSIAADCLFSQTAGLAGSTVADPQFVTTARGDFRLGAESPALDACTTIASTDLDGQSRPLGPGADAGAFERLLDAIFSDRFEE